MKIITHRNSTRSAFLSGACLALLAVPCVSIGEVKITASRDYVDKKVAAAVTNLTAYVDGSVTTVTTNLQAQISALPTINSASTLQEGIVQLSSLTNSTSEVMAATPKAVKYAIDEARAVEQRVGQMIGECAQKSDLEGYVKLADVTNIVMNIVIAKYGNVAWKTEDAGQTLDAFYHELPYTDGVTTNATRTVQGQDSYLKFENGNITVYSSSTNAVPHSAEDSGR